MLEHYIHMATKEGVCQAVFPEGRLSRDGRLGAPKLGALDYMLRNYDSLRDRDIVFIPVGFNDNRTLEDRSLLRTLSAYDVENRVTRLIAQLQANGTQVYVTTRSRVEAILKALEMLRIIWLMVESEGVYRAASGEDDILTYYANSVAHWTPPMVE